MSSSAIPASSIPKTPTAVLATDAAPKPKPKWAKRTKEQKKVVHETSEVMWMAIRLKQEGAHKDINALAPEWNRYQYDTSIHAMILTEP